MKKPIRSQTIITVSFFLVAITLSAFALAEAGDGRSGRPRQRFQQRIDVLTKCMQPVLVRLQADLVREASDQEANLGALLGTSLVSHEIQEAFLRHYLAHGESPEDFWNSLGEDPLFTDDVLYEVRLSLFLGHLTYYNLPLLLQLRGFRQAEGLNTLRDISMVSRESWRELLAESGVDQDPEAFLRRIEKTFDVLLFGGCN